VLVLRWMVVIFLILVCLATWVPSIRIGGIAPDLLIGVVFVFALRKGLTWGVWTGFVVGLLVSVEQPSTLGADSAAMILAAVVVDRGGNSLDRHNPLVLVFLLFGASLAAESVRVIAMARGEILSLPALWIRWAFPAAVYTAVALPLFAWIAGKLLGRRDWLLRAP
jgi:rod shape-determining protein MreD